MIYCVYTTKDGSTNNLRLELLKQHQLPLTFPAFDTIVVLENRDVTEIDVSNSGPAPRTFIKTFKNERDFGTYIDSALQAMVKHITDLNLLEYVTHTLNNIYTGIESVETLVATYNEVSKIYNIQIFYKLDTLINFLYTN